MVKLTLLSVALVVTSHIAVRADDEDSKRRVRVALALSQARSPVAAPAPRPSTPPTYREAYTKAIKDQSPMVIFVGCNGHKVPDAVAGRADTLEGVTSPAVLVSYPVNGAMFREVILACPVTDAALKKAVDAARRKIETQPAGASPLARPLNWKI